MTNKEQPQSHSSVRSYLIGFVASIVLTLAAYFSVVNHLFSNTILQFTIAELAVMQLLVQLFFFLHMGKETKPRWNLAMFLSAVSVILILVIGSIWIMNHLNYQMSPQQMDQYILKDELIKK